MSAAPDDKQPWIADDEPPAYELVNIEGRSRAVLVCDHASPVIPCRLGTLGLSPRDRERHVAWDIGAASVARRLSGILDAPLALPGYSRLVVDCNRPLHEPEAFATQSEDVVITGNQSITKQEKAARADAFFSPYHDALHRLVETRTAGGADIYGDGVNIAARLETLAEAGGVFISGTVFDHVRNKVALEFEDLGERQVKNIPEPLRVYRLVVGTTQEVRSVSTFETEIGLDFSIPDTPSIAVLPFTVMGDDPEQVFFADGVAEDIFAVQDEITREIVTALDVQLREGEQHRVWSRGTENLEAWECVRLATDDVLGGDAEKRPRATELIERALALNPNYAIAWAMRGWLYFTEADVGGGLGDRDRFDKAQAGAFHCGRRALEIDSDCADAYGMLALTQPECGRARRGHGHVGKGHRAGAQQRRTPRRRGLGGHAEVGPARARRGAREKGHAPLALLTAWAAESFG